MWFLAFILILVISSSEFDLFIGISDLISSLHSSCLNFTPESFYSNIYAALVCGNDLESSLLTQNFKNLGIYHAIIVSGSHLIFLSTILEIFINTSKFKFLRLAAFPILFIYSLATGFQPPVVRALLSIAINAYQKKKKLFWNQQEVIFVSLLICLALVDPWKKSYSLLLSYVASISVSLFSKKNSVVKNISIYFLILPFLLPMSAPSPFSFLSNMFFTPLIGVVLFPLSFMAYIIPYFYILVDPIWRIFIYLCSLIGPEMQNLDKISVSLVFLWGFAIFINFYGIFNQKRM